VGKEVEPIEIRVAGMSTMLSDSSNNHIDDRDDNHECLSPKRGTIDVCDEDRLLPRHSDSVAAKICKEINHESLKQKELYIHSNDNRDDSNISRNQNGIRMNTHSSLVHYRFGGLRSSRSAYYNSLEKRAKNRSNVSRKENPKVRVQHPKGKKSNGEKKVAILRRKVKTRVQVPSKDYKTTTTGKPKTGTVFSRLYSKSQCMQEEGKRRRREIEKIRREREKRKQEQYHQTPTKKISVARASKIYYRGMEKKISLERRIAESTKKHSTVPYKSHLLANNNKVTSRAIY
jgi:hypothetical protein